MSIDLMKENGLALKKVKKPTISFKNYADDIAILVNTPA